MDNREKRYLLNHKSEYKFYFLIFLFFLSIYSILQPGHIYNPDTAIRYQLTKDGIILHHHIYTYHSLDKIGRDTIKRKNRYYTKWLIGQSVLMVPLYYMGKLMGKSREDETEEFLCSFLSAIFTSLTCLLIFIFGIHLKFSPKISFLLSLIYGFSTFAAIMARGSYDIVETSFFILLSIFYIFLYSKHLKKKFIIFSGISYGLAVNIRYTPFIILPLFLMFLFMIRKNRTEFLRDSILFILILLPFFAYVLYYNKIAFGSIFRTGYTDKFNANFFWGLYGLLFSPRHGLIFFAPISILSLWAFPKFFRRLRTLSLLFFFVILFYIFLHAKFEPWDSGFQFGPRFLLPILPLLIIPIGFVFKRMKRYIIILSALGFFLILPAFLINHMRYWYWLDTRNIHSINNFQEIELWKMLPEITGKMKAGIPWKLSLYSSGFTHNEMLEKSRTMNIFDLWYVQMYYLKYPIKILAGGVFFFILIAVVTGYLINKEIKIKNVDEILQ